MYVLLIIILCILSIGAYILNKREIMSPTVISCIAYLMSAILAVIGLKSWNNVELSIKPIIIIIIGLISFAIGEYVIRKIFGKKDGAKHLLEEETDKSKIVKIKLWKMIASILFISITIILLFLNIREICLNAGYKGNDIGEMLTFYKNKSQLFSTELVKTNNTINIFVSQMNKACYVLGIIFIYILLNNIVNKDKIKNNILYITAIILCFILAFITGSRSQIIKYVIAMIIMGTIIYSKNYDSRKTIIKFFKVAIISAFIVLPLFYFMLPLLGKSIDKDFTEYISFYLGAPIPSFEKYLQNPPTKDEHFGSESLRGIYSLLYKLKLTDFTSPVSREWVSFENRYHSNIYTAFRRYMQDFGITGVIICQFIFGSVFTILYLLAKNKNNPQYLIFYGLFTYMLIDQIRDELFFTTFVHINILINVILIAIEYFVLFDFEFSKMNDYKDWIVCKWKKIIKRFERITDENRK